MIGDSDKDLGAARNFGIDSVLFYPAEHKKFYDLEKLKELEPTYFLVCCHYYSACFISKVL